MKFGLKTLLTAAVVAALAGCNANNSVNTNQANAAVVSAVQSSERPEAHRARDKYRNPLETLEFFGLQSDMTVVEITPGGGWYSEILAPTLKGKGTLYAAHFPADSEIGYYKKSLASFKDKVANDPRYSEVKVTEFFPVTHLDIAPASSADMVLTFRNVHNWYMQKDHEGLLSAFKAFNKALKPGGILGVVEHQLPEDRDDAQQKSSGYMKLSYVVDVAKQAGFELVAQSDINANPKDSADHPKGVWTLPPHLTMGEEQAEKYKAIGESNRMTLKFKKL
ncbi:methyltransferase [Pseudoalteromonas sp. MMG022]|uniref:class I SAM-dependent methyltransferase n=1 Tax=Pseudoalteromonas sp. MMG022 TaxID=2909978 RepID=UPI001F24EDC6|nr:methyltransferase [Pseudoalteromonas sp. MMG022]MCF6435335.1 methyltransferase [Pseudoalteromonas sp. MMG022]